MSHLGWIGVTVVQQGVTKVKADGLQVTSGKMCSSPVA